MENSRTTHNVSTFTESCLWMAACGNKCKTPEYTLQRKTSVLAKVVDKTIVAPLFVITNFYPNVCTLHVLNNYG